MSSQRNALISLQDILKAEIDLHQALWEQLQEEARGFGILSGNELLKIQRGKDRIVEQVIRQEEKRISLVDQFPRLWPLQSSPFTLGIIIQLAPADQAKSLQHCFDELQTILLEIRVLAERNSLESSARLKSVEASMRFLTEGSSRQQPTYSGSGELQHSSSKVSRTSV